MKTASEIMELSKGTATIIKRCVDFIELDLKQLIQHNRDLSLFVQTLKEEKAVLQEKINRLEKENDTLNAKNV